MSNVEKYICYVIATLFLYGIVVTRAYMAQRKKMRYYKRKYESQARVSKLQHKATACEQIIDFLMILSPIK